jgi:hypothetical protein
MNDKNMNQEGTNPEDRSEDEILKNGSYDVKENFIPDEGAQDSRGGSSYSSSSPNDQSFGKMADQITPLKAPEQNINQSKSLSMNSDLRPQKRNASQYPT